MVEKKNLLEARSDRCRPAPAIPSPDSALFSPYFTVSCLTEPPRTEQDSVQLQRMCTGDINIPLNANSYCLSTAQLPAVRLPHLVVRLRCVLIIRQFINQSRAASSKY